MGKIGFGVIGCGVIAPTHMQAIEAVEDAELIACCDVIEERAVEKKEKFGAQAHYTDLEEMLKRDDIQAVSVCTPSGMHGDHAIAAAQAGKHILCEKPLEITLSKIDEMIATCKECDVKLAGVFQRRTYETSKKVREAVQSGLLGQMVLGDAYQKYYRSPEYYLSGEWRATWELDGGGALMNQGVHGIDLLLWIMGKVKTVTAHCEHLVRDIPCEDTAVALLRFENGAMGVLQGTTSVTPGYGCRIELHGGKGSIVLKESDIVEWKVEGEDESEVTAKEGVKPGEGTAADPTAGLTATGHTLHVADLCAAIREDREPFISGEEARPAVEVILSCYCSQVSGQTVELPLDPEWRPTHL